MLPPPATITRRDAAILITLFAVTRLLLVIVGVAALTFLSSNEGTEFTHLLDGGKALDMWYRWDAGFYASIATYGYDWVNDGTPAGDMAFMPVYPMLVRAVSGMGVNGCPASPYLSTCATIGGLIVSNSALLASTFLLFWLAQRRYGRLAAWRATVLLLVSPISIFLSGVYTESLFLLLTLLTAVSLERRQFLTAVAAALVASLTRSVGMALCAMLLSYVWKVWYEGKRRLTFLILARFALALLPGIVFAGYVLLAGLSVGDPTAYFKTYEQVYQRVAGTPIQAFTVYFSGEPVSWFGWRVSWIDLFMTLFFLALAIWLTLRERRPIRGEGVYALGALALPITSGTLTAMPRFGSVLFPFYVLLGRWANRAWRMALIYGGSAALALLFTVQFVTWKWIA